MQSKASIVICSYNHADFLSAAIDSALNQDYKNLEIIVVDDGSTDHTSQVLSNYVGLVDIYKKSNEGQISGYNYGFSKSTGSVVFFLDADDFYYENCVGLVMNAINDPEVIKVHFFMDCVDEKCSKTGQRIPRILSDGQWSRRFSEHGALYYSAPGSGNAYKREFLEKILPLPIFPDDKHGADFYLIYAASLFGKIFKLEESVGAYRVLVNKGIRESLVFGNAASSKSEPLRQINREKRLLSIIENKYPDYCVKVRELISLPTLKLKIGGVFLDESYSIFRPDFWRLFFHLIRCTLVDGEPRFFSKFALVLWAFGTSLMPKNLRAKSVRYACNPMSR